MSEEYLSLQQRLNLGYDSTDHHLKGIVYANFERAIGISPHSPIDDKSTLEFMAIYLPSECFIG